MSDFFGALVEGAFNLAGSAIDHKQAAVGRGQQMDLARDQLAFQNDLAHHGVRYRVDDARRAGIHPGLALGMQPFNPTPVNVSGSSGGNFAQSFANAGHSFSRAIDSTRTQAERDHARTMAALQLENAGLQNDYIRSQIARLQRDQVGPPMVDPANPGVRMFGTSDASGLIKEEPMQRQAAAPDRPHQEAGAVTDLGFSRTPTGWAIVPSKDWKDRGEDQLVPEATWAIRNHLLPTLSPSRYGMPPPESWLPEGAEWRFDRLKQEWQARFTNRAQKRVRYPIN